MATTLLIKTETRQDYVGPYTAYIYADGHVETDPPNRPQSREDVQRARLATLAQQQTSAALAANKSAAGQNAITPPMIVQENLAVAPGLVAFPSFEEVLHDIETIAASSTSFLSEDSLLLNTVSLGGNIPGVDVQTAPIVQSVPQIQEWSAPVGVTEI